MTAGPRPAAAVALLAAAVVLTACSADADPGQPRPQAAASAPGALPAASGPAPAPAGSASAVPSEATTSAIPDPVVLDLADLEATYDARIGVYAVDTGSGRSVEHRADERFAYASTIKALAVGVLLDHTSPEQLLEPVPIAAADITSAYSPVTEQRVGTSMTLEELAAAAAQESDNSAANIVIARLGGPAGLEQALRSLGDTVTEVDRLEPELNEAVPGDPRDTSSPRAMATGLADLAVGDALDDADRAVLNGWLEGSTTGTGLVRAAVPEGWTVGDKSGSGRYGTRNDIAVVRPPGAAPIVVAVMTSRAEEDAERSDAAVAAAAARVLETLAG